MNRTKPLPAHMRPRPFTWLVAQFWAKVEVRGYGECWPWRAATDNGYGKVKWGRRTRGAHVVAYELSCGPVPEGMCVCHECDNPLCCNPFHLWLGTKAQNNADRDRKGRHWRNACLNTFNDDRAKRPIDQWRALSA